MNKKPLVIVGVIAFCAIQLITLWYFAGSFTQGVDRSNAVNQADEIREKAILAGGVPDQRKRIEDAIESAARLKDLDEAESSLNVVGDELNLAFSSAANSAALDPPSKLHQVLADRRVAKVYAYLEEMHPNDASQRASSLFDRNLRRHRSDLDRYVARLRGQDSTRDSIPVSGNSHALAASLFLCLIYCDQSVFLDNADRWEAEIGPLYHAGRSEPALASLFLMGADDGPPQGLMLLNMYIILLDREKKMSVDEVSSAIKRRLPIFRRVNFTAWDAHTGDLDFTHIHRRVPTDNKKIMDSFVIAKAWGGTVPFDDYNRQRQILAAVRKLL